MQLIVFLGLLVGTALATTNVEHPEIPVWSLNRAYSLNYLACVPCTVMHYREGKIIGTYLEKGMKEMPKDLGQHLNKGDNNMVVVEEDQIPNNVTQNMQASDMRTTTGHGQLTLLKLLEILRHPIVLVLSDNEKNQLFRVEQLNEVGRVKMTHDGKMQIVKDVFLERLQVPRYGAFSNPYGFSFQGSHNAYPFNYELPYFALQSQYSGYGGHGAYPSFNFQAQYPYYGFQAQYPFYGSQGQHPSCGYQGQFYNYGPAVKTSPTFPGYNPYNPYMGYNFPGIAGPYLYPTILGNPTYALGYNYIPSSYYPLINPFYLYGQRTQQEEANKAYSGQQGPYPPFTFLNQQLQHQYGYQNQGYPFSYYQAYPFNQPGAKAYQYTPFQFQEYQYQPYQFQQYQPNYFPQYHPFQYQFYQNYQPFFGQHYPQ